MRDLTQQILNKLISTSTGDINGKIIDLYDKMNSVYNDLSNSSTNYTKGKIADLYTKMNNIYNELNSTSTSYMKGKINSIYTKVMTSGDEEEFIPNFNCNRLVATSIDENVYYPNPLPYSTRHTGLKCILNFNPPKTAIYRIDSSQVYFAPLGKVDLRGEKLQILNGINYKDHIGNDGGYTNYGASFHGNYYTNVKYDIEKQNFLKDINHNELMISLIYDQNFMSDYKYFYLLDHDHATAIFKINNYNLSERKTCSFEEQYFRSIYYNKIYQTHYKEIYMKLYKGLNLVIAKNVIINNNYGPYGSVVKVYSS